jgi:hypothetical protein
LDDLLIASPKDQLLFRWVNDEESPALTTLIE